MAILKVFFFNSVIVAQMITYSLGIQTQFEIFRGPGYDFLAPTQERRYFSSLITPFDALIHERESCGFPNCASVEKQLSFKKAAELFNGINVTLWSKEQCIQAIRNNKTILDTATKLRQLQNSNRLELRFSDGSRVSIEHFKGMYYLGRKYKNSADFILAHLHSVKLSDKLSSLKIESVYGPIGLKILEELGYATRGRPEVLRLNMKGSLATIDN